MGSSTATIKLVTSDGSTHVACSVGVGPVDSAYKAINLIVKVWKFDKFLIAIFPFNYTPYYYKHLPIFIVFYFVHSIEIYWNLTTRL